MISHEAFCAIRRACTYMTDDKAILAWAKSQLDADTTLVDIVRARKANPTRNTFINACRRRQPIENDSHMATHRQMMRDGSERLLARMIETGCTWRRAA